MTDSQAPHDLSHITDMARDHRGADPVFAEWAKGYGVIKHTPETQVRVYRMVDLLHERRVVEDKATAYKRLKAADRLASAGMWLIVHMTYTRRVYCDGRPLEVEDFKADPQGHTGGSLNMAIAYVGYMAINALSGITRSWLMGQGHCVAAIDAINLLTGNLSAEQVKRYSFTDEGMSAFVDDFYSYAIDADGRPSSPLGSHVGPHTAGGMIEGGYLGFGEILYPHMPLPGERLVAFLSDGAFEEQRGGDWAPRWWRADDTGLLAPIMIANGRRIDQRSTMAQSGGVDWFRRHLELNSFDPIDIDGKDPASFACGIFEMEDRSLACESALADGSGHYPMPLHYGIAETPKGFGFPGAGTNAAHNLPLGTNPHVDEEARRRFNDGASALFVPLDEIKAAINDLETHSLQERPKEMNHPMVSRPPVDARLPEPEWTPTDAMGSPMAAIDGYFCDILLANPDLRPRVGNPDEMRSNYLNATLDLLKHRVTAPEAGVAEAVEGKVITALNEEAVVCAALGNKGGINLVCSYEAFAVKMLGALRQDIIFARHQREVGQSPGWLGLPLLLTSHVWENGKNEQSHQDPTLAEALMGEMSDGSRVLFAADDNTAQAGLRSIYRDHGIIGAMVVPKRPQPRVFDATQALALWRDGAIRLGGTGGPDETLLLVATGGYQLTEARTASARLSERGIPHGLVYIGEPGRFREPRDAREAAQLAPQDVVASLFPATAEKRIFLTHTRTAPFIGTLRPLDTGPASTRVLGYINHGGTLDTKGMLYANGCTWAHVLKTAADLLGMDVADLLNDEERAALEGVDSLKVL